MEELSITRTATLWGITAQNRNQLINFTESLPPESHYPGAVYFLIRLACGGIASYQNKEDIPYTTTPCNCGAPYYHGFILYTEEGE